MSFIKEIYWHTKKISSARETSVVAFLFVIPVYLILHTTGFFSRVFGIVEVCLPILSKQSVYMFTTRMEINEVTLSYLLTDLFILISLLFVFSSLITFVNRTKFKDLVYGADFIKFPLLIFLISILAAYFFIYLLGLEPN